MKRTRVSMVLAALVGALLPASASAATHWVVDADGFATDASCDDTVAADSSTIGGAVGVPFAAQNGIQIGFGATAIVKNNAVSGNDYTPETFVACGILYFDADGVRANHNTLFDNERDVCNFGRGGGQYNPDF